MSLTAVYEKAKNIRLLLLDVDGVLTDGRLYFSNEGIEFKTFHSLDGQGIKFLQSTGVVVGIITGRKSELLKRRASELGIELLIQGRKDKFNALQEMLQTFPCELEHIAFMGDDLPDLSVMTQVGLSMTVANGHKELKQRAHWQSQKKGGQGAVREACDLIMEAQGSYHSILNQFINAAENP